MSALNIKKGSSSHSAYDLRDPNAPVTETHTLAVLVDNKGGVVASVIGII
jgi:acetolactate synthase-1/3 small subunit